MLGQVIVDPSSPTPTLTNGGWVYDAAILLAVLGLIVTLLVVLGYMRFAPRFQTGEQERRTVRAPRIQPHGDVRRPVNVTSAPLVVQPPVVAIATPAAVSAPAPVVAPAAVAVAAPPTTAPTPAAVATARAPTLSPAATETPAPAPDASEHREVALDQETFDATLAELLAKGTDRRVAEGQARRAAMLAARKKAEG